MHTIFLIIGLKFWKVGSRKLYAVQAGGRGKRKQEEPEAAMVKRLKDMDGKISKVLALSAAEHPLTAAVVEAFKCAICLSGPLRPPAVVGKCCRRIIGCGSCVEEWYRQEDEEQSVAKRCPLCQCADGHAHIMEILGVDDVIDGARATDREPRPVSPPIQHVPPAPDAEEIDSDW